MEHSGHDVDHLLKRWRSLADRHGWKVTLLLEVDGLPVLAIENGKPGDRATYLSAGIHGDECAPIWALLQWAENASEAELAQPLLIFPCLNPHGIVGNTRRDQDGIDLNRSFHRGSVRLVSAWKEFLGERQFDFALNLHEDYDATGIYLYELVRGESVGHQLLDCCEELIPREPSNEVEGREFDNGLMMAAGEDVREIIKEDLEDEWPEAIYLCLEHNAHSMTFETPSELGLALRIATQRRFIESVVEMRSKQD